MSKIKLDRFAAALDLEVLYSADLTEFEVTTQDVNRPGLALTGFFDYFPVDRVQVIGKQEMTYLLSALADEPRYHAMDSLMGCAFPCLVLSRGFEPPLGLLQLAVKHKRIVLRSQLSTYKLIASLTTYLGLVLAPHETRHGVLVDVFGIGLLITGESGIGKSETALELLRRGHRLVADDLVEIRRVGTDQLIGTSPENIRHFMEIRGVGIVNVRQMYGIGSVMIQKSIDMIAKLEQWDKNKEYERIGIEEDREQILEVPLTKLIIPVIPGRNLAIIIEVAARNQRLKNMGYNSAVELHKLINGTIDGAEEL